MKFSIIIPTRERCETLNHALRTCTTQDYPNLDIIVSDNMSADATQQVVQSANDPRVRYVNPGRRLSMADNFEFALSFAAPGFVMFIGDDDGVMPGGVSQAAQIAEAHQVQAVTCRPAVYRWPGVTGPEDGGMVSIGVHDDRIEIRSTRVELIRALRFNSHYVFELPMVYGGFVHTDVFNAARFNGRFFNSVTPDAYAAFVVAMTINSFAYSHRPFLIGGASRRSTGLSAMGAVGDASEAETFVKENTRPFHADFVYCPSYPVIAGEAFTQAAACWPDRSRDLVLDKERMLRLALHEMNDRTREEVGSAVTRMAEMYRIDRASLSPARFIDATSRQRSLRLKSALGSRRFVGCENAQKFGVSNVYDASVLAAALLALNNGHRFETVWGQLASGVRARLLGTRNGR